MNLREVGEDRLLQQITKQLRANPDVIAGAGDDCAVMRFRGSPDLLVLKTDCVVENIHFAAAEKPADIGWKAMARPLSDFAAMSAVPQFALVTLIVPSDREFSWVQKLYRGIERAARRFDVSVVGGETSDISGPAVVSLSVTGFVEKKR